MNRLSNLLAASAFATILAVSPLAVAQGSAVVISSFTTNKAVPSSAPVGVTYDGTNLIIAHSAGSGPFVITSLTGTTVKSFDPLGNCFLCLIAPGDPAWDGTSLWVNDEFANKTFRVARPAGTILSSFSTSALETKYKSFRLAHAWDGKSLWAATSHNSTNSTIIRLDAKGKELSSFTAPCNLTGLAFARGTFWGVTLRSEVCQFSSTGALLAKMTISPKPSRAQGMAYDGTNFWTMENTGTTDRALRLRVTTAPIAVRMASFEAARVDQSVRLSWRTASELSCGSFEVRRCEGACASGDGYDARPDIPHVGCTDSLTGARYAVTDPSARADRSYGYMLRETETTGGVNDYGPVHIAAGEKHAAWVPAPAADAPSTPSFPATGCSTGGAGGAASGGLLLAMGILLWGRRRR